MGDFSKISCLNFLFHKVMLITISNYVGIKCDHVYKANNQVPKITKTHLCKLW